MSAADRMQREDGGAAFPVATSAYHTNLGMTLRDYFAIHATQPGEAEIATLAGVKIRGVTHTWEQEPEAPSFPEWWRGLSNEERFRLSAIVRYQQADAMIRERSK